MENRNQTEQVHTLVIGGGQAGLSVGYHLAQRGIPFVILDAADRIGDAWRKRWDSLRLFTPARFDGLDGMPFPASSHSFPTKNDMADYLEAYAAKFDLHVRNGVQVDRLTRDGSLYIAKAGGRRFVAQHVVIAMSGYQKPRIPKFAGELNPDIVRLHSSQYRNPEQLKKGPVLIVGAGNSGSEIAMDVAKLHRTWMSGRDTGSIPFRIDGAAAKLFLARFIFRVVFHRVLTVRTPMGRKMRAKMLLQGGPLIRVKPEDLTRAGIQRVPRVKGVREGLPLLDDGRVLEASNVIWCTGFHPGLSWVELPVFDDNGMPEHESGVADGEPGLYFVGLPFTHSLSSTMVHGVGRDAARIAGVIQARSRAGKSAIAESAKLVAANR